MRTDELTLSANEGFNKAVSVIREATAQTGRVHLAKSTCVAILNSIHALELVSAFLPGGFQHNHPYRTWWFAGRRESSRGATDVVIHTEGDERQTVDLTVTQRDSETSSIDTSLELELNSQTKINNEVIMGSDYDVEVTVTNMTTKSPYTETQEWNDAGNSLHIILHEQIVFAVQIG